MPVKNRPEARFIAPADLASRWAVTRQSMANLLAAKAVPHFQVGCTKRIPLGWVHKMEADAGEAAPLLPDDLMQDEVSANALAARWGVEAGTISKWKRAGLLKTNSQKRYFARYVREIERDAVRVVFEGLATKTEEQHAAQ